QAGRACSSRIPNRVSRSGPGSEADSVRTITSSTTPGRTMGSSGAPIASPWCSRTDMHPRARTSSMTRCIARSWLALIVTLAALAPAARTARAETTDAILDSLQYGAFRYAWDQANPGNGLLRDRSQPGSPCSIAAQGFGFSAICIGVDHGWVSRATAATRVLTTLQTYWNSPQGPAINGMSGYKGLY